MQTSVFEFAVLNANGSQRITVTGNISEAGRVLLSANFKVFWLSSRLHHSLLPVVTITFPEILQGLSLAHFLAEYQKILTRQCCKVMSFETVSNL